MATLATAPRSFITASGAEVAASRPSIDPDGRGPELDARNAIPIRNRTGDSILQPAAARRALHAWPDVSPGRTNAFRGARGLTPAPDRKSTRLNSSHHSTSYAVF